MGDLIGGGDMMHGGDLTPRVACFSAGADGSGDVGLLPFMEAAGVLFSSRGAGDRSRFRLSTDLSSFVLFGFIVTIGDGLLLRTACN